MKYQHYNLNYLQKGQTIEINLSGNSANVKLMDTNNFYYYKNGKSHRYYGGHAKSSLTRLVVPQSGNWHLTIDLGGYTGNVSSNIRVY